MRKMPKNNINISDRLMIGVPGIFVAEFDLCVMIRMSDRKSRKAGREEEEIVVRLECVH